jgi:glycosyltransferase involved in cell wall biosynthesis
VRNIFGLSSDGRAGRAARPTQLRLIALGTVEPRKNFLAAAEIAAALAGNGFDRVTLDIVGREGWSDDWERLTAIPGVKLHGYQTTESAASIIDGADAFICTSHEEGLGLPLLEAQYAGLPVIAPDQPIFREVLGDSGLYVDTRDPGAAAQMIASSLCAAGWRQTHATCAAENLRRWNAIARADRDAVVDAIARLARSLLPGTPTMEAAADVHE